MNDQSIKHNVLYRMFCHMDINLLYVCHQQEKWYIVIIYQSFKWLIFIRFIVRLSYFSLIVYFIQFVILFYITKTVTSVSDYRIPNRTSGASDDIVVRTQYCIPSGCGFESG